MTRMWIALAFAALLAACAPSGADRGSTTYDSAGIAIRTISAQAAAPRWRVVPEPVMSIGAVEGAPEYMLDDVRGAVRLPDGGVVLANSGSGELRWYDARGRHVRTAGGDGGGPGEFLSLAGLAAGADGRVHAWDASSLRLTTFGGDGRMEGQWSVAPDSFGPNVQLAGVLDARSVLLLDGSNLAFTVSPKARRGSLHIWRASPDGRVRRMMTVAGPERITWRLMDGAGRSPAPFARSTLAAVAAGRLWIGDNDAYELRAYGPGGAPERVIRRDAERRKVSRDDIAEFSRDWRERASSNALPNADEERALAGMPFPETHPAFSALHADAEGRLWVRERDDPAGSHWAVHDGDGRLAGSLSLPPRAEPLHISAHHVVARWTDEDGVEFVRVYRFQP